MILKALQYKTGYVFVDDKAPIEVGNIIAFVKDNKTYTDIIESIHEGKTFFGKYVIFSLDFITNDCNKVIAQTPDLSIADLPYVSLDVDLVLDHLADEFFNKMMSENKGFNLKFGWRNMFRFIYTSIANKEHINFLKPKITSIDVEYEEYITDGWIPTYNDPDNINGYPSAEIDYRPVTYTENYKTYVKLIHTEYE